MEKIKQEKNNNNNKRSNKKEDNAIFGMRTTRRGRNRA